MPHIPDKWYAFAVAKTYYKELIEAGVQIYEYLPGFIHAKVFVSDDDTATVGTINLDYRSLYLHFECGAFIYSSPVIADIEQDFQETKKQCKLITMEEYKNPEIEIIRFEVEDVTNTSVIINITNKKIRIFKYK